MLLEIHLSVSISVILTLVCFSEMALKAMPFMKWVREKSDFMWTSMKRQTDKLQRPIFSSSNKMPWYFTRFLRLIIFLFLAFFASHINKALSQKLHIFEIQWRFDLIIQRSTPNENKKKIVCRTGAVSRFASGAHFFVFERSKLNVSIR